MDASCFNQIVRPLDPILMCPTSLTRDQWADEWVGLGWAGSRKSKLVDDLDDPEADLDAWRLLGERLDEENPEVGSC